MHLGLKTGPLCPCLYQVIGAVSLTKFQMVPTPSTLMSSGSKKKEPRYTCLSEAKVSHSPKICTEVSFSVPHKPKKALFLNQSSRWPLDLYLNIPGSETGTRIYSSNLSKVPADEPHPGPPTVPPWRGPSTGNLASLSKTSSFRFPSKGALPPGPLHGIPHSEMPHH
jgi:hypothetical protein